MKRFTPAQRKILQTMEADLQPLITRINEVNDFYDEAAIRLLIAATLIHRHDAYPNALGKAVKLLLEVLDRVEPLVEPKKIIFKDFEFYLSDLEQRN